MIKDEKHLRSSICVPSVQHAYSLSMEFTKNWFLSKFNENYFKTIHIDQKHILDDFRNNDMYRNLKKLKPSVSITPQINFDYDREKLDMYGAGLDLYIKRHKVNSSFFRDTERNMYLDAVLEQLETTYTFRIRVSTRAQQIDLFKYINMAFRIGTTQGHEMDMDFHIPYSIMLQVAQDAGFEINDDDTIKNVVDFVKYLNTHSALPISYKLRTVNGKSEFFMRLNDVYIHVSCLDTPSADDGEREGMLYSNYIIEFSVIVKFPAPKFYVYYSTEPHDQIEVTEVEGSRIGLYNIKIPDIPEVNSKGWEQLLVTSYCADIRGEIAEIEFKELIEGSEVEKVITYLKKMKISPAIFIDFLLYDNGSKIDFKVDWENYKIITVDPISNLVIDISMYADLIYMKDQLRTIREITKDRIKK